MVELLKEIPPFCDRVSSPPTPLPLLTAQTDLLYAIASPPSLIAQEPLPSSTSAPTLGFGNRVRSSRRSTPHPLPFGRTVSSTLRFALQPEAETRELNHFSESSSYVPKPVGEVSRPGRGGYNLADKLGWEAEEYEALKVSNYSSLSTKLFPSNSLQNYVHTLSEDWLDQSLAYSMQAKNKIRAVCDAVRTN
jgi:hypothetical protein